MNGATADGAAGTLLSPTRTPQIAFAAIACTVVIFLLGATVERWLIGVLRPSAGELTWISDVVLATGFGVVLYLWLRLRAAREALLEAERAQIVLNTQFEIAANMQRSLLPPAPAARRGVSWAVQLTPAYRIGGDYYDFVDLDGDGRVFIIGDIFRQGCPRGGDDARVPVRAVFRLAVRQTREPREIVARLAEAIRTNTGGNPYMTCIVGRVDEEARQLWVTNAGHPGAVVIAGNTERCRFGANGQPSRAAAPPRLRAACHRRPRRQWREVFVTDGISERLPTGSVGHVRRPSRARHGVTTVRVRRTTLPRGHGATSFQPLNGWDDVAPWPLGKPYDGRAQL